MSTDWLELRVPRSKRRARSRARANAGSVPEGLGREGLGREGLGREGHGGESYGPPLTDAARKRLNTAAPDGGLAKCMASGMRLLASREYSVLELTTKLARRFDGDVVAAAISELTSQQLLDDARYGEAFCRSRVERGYGYNYIHRELQQNGLAPELIDSLLSPYEEQWFDRALALARKAHRPAKTQVLHSNYQHHEVDGFVDDVAAGGDDGVEAGADENRGRGRGSGGRDLAWEQRQKERARLARMLARRGFSGSMASKAIDEALKGAIEGLEAPE